MPDERRTKWPVADAGDPVGTAPAETATDPGFAIVAVGASAGGLEALRKMLEAVPADSGLAFIFVQHLDPHHQSLIPELLRDHTRLVVEAARDGRVIERDHLYIIEPGTFLSVHNGFLHVASAEAPHGVRLPFDVLLTSLADYAGSRSVCVVLSGTGADGTVGLAAVNRAGGFVVVQDPHEAAYDGMPQSAVLTGLADAVLPVDKIPAAFLAFARGASVLPDEGTASEIPESPATLADIIALLRAKTPHDFTYYKQGTLMRGVERRMAARALPPGAIADYIGILQDDHKERDSLTNALLINVTSFFRDRQVFDRLKETIVPELLKAHGPEEPLRIWIAGCSSGEEAYSIAMMFREGMADLNSSVKLQIFASDVDADAVATARDGFYPATINVDVSEERLSRFFTKEDHGYRVMPDIRSSVVFTVQDILVDPPFSRIDMVSCRNLLIYLKPEAQAKAIALFHFALRDGGVLLLGSSETIGKGEGRFETISKSDRVYRHIGRSRPGDMMFSLNGSDVARAPQRPGSQAPVVKLSILADTCKRKVLELYAPAAVVVNQKNECLYTIGKIADYLAIAPGYPTIDLLAMTPPALHTKLRSAIQRCSQQNTGVIATGGEIDDGRGFVKRFAIHVDPIEYDGLSLFLICFIDESIPPAAGPLPSSGLTDPGRIHALESELKATRIELNGAISNLEISSQEQKAINEEALSFNEEYQSTNEELLTSKEELQSLNEELTALNGQLQETLERQRTTSNDLQNILYSTAVATIFLDADLKIRFFTPATKTLFNVIPTDIGRPLSDLTSLAIDTTLISDARLVLTEHKPLEHKIEAKSGFWYMRRIMPYLDEEHVIEGVVITFVDVTEQRHTSEALRVAKRQAEVANAAKSRFLSAASHDLRQPLQTLSLLQGLLARQAPNEKSQKLLARFEGTLGAMSGMLNALLDINQIEAGIVKAEMADFGIQQLLTKLSRELKYSAASQGLDFRVVDSSVFVHTDPHMLEQMVRNLLSNAFKYTRTGKVLLGCRRKGMKATIEVWDTGMGIPEGELKMIFEEFHQIDNVARERSKGLGLGLSIVQRLCDLLGHGIDVKSRQSRGSVFSIEMDIVASGVTPPSKAPDHPTTPAAPVSLRGNILLVEDDPEVRVLLHQLLTDDGHKVSSVADGPAALGFVASANRTPDVILSDYNLPGGMNGVEVVAALRKLCGCDIPAIILTGDISTQTLTEITGTSMIQLNKPISPGEVASAVERFLPQVPKLGGAPLLQLPGHAARAVLIEKPIIYVVDDDDDLRLTLCQLIENHGFATQSYASSEDFLQGSNPAQGGCLLVDAHLPGMGGVHLLQHLKRSGRKLGAIMMTGHSEIQMAVDAMKAGALDFIEKPIGHADLLEIIDRAVERAGDVSKRGAWVAKAVMQIASLTARQKEIMELVLAGHPSKNIAADLHISQRTVENHRASIMEKTASKSLPALARLALAAAEAT